MRKILLLVAYVFSITLIGQTNIKGIVTNQFGEGIENATVFSEWVEGKAIKRNFATTLKDGTFWVKTSKVPFKLTVEHPSYTNYSLQKKDSSFVSVKLISTNKVKELKPLVLSSTRFDNGGNNKTNVSKRQLAEQNSAVDLPLMLKFQPSITTTSDAGNGVGYSGIRIRGTDATRINVTLNGIPVNDAESQGVWWVNTPDLASSLKSIQITRGVGSSTNGAAAFGGTVSLESDNPAEAVNRAEIAYGSFNTMRTTVAVNTGPVGPFAGGIRISNIKSDGYVDRASSELNSYQMNLAYNTNNTKVRFIHLKGEEKTYQSWYGIDRSMLETNRIFNWAGAYYDAAGNEKFYDNQTDNYSQSHYQLFVDRSIISEDYLNVALSGGLFYTKGQGYYEEYAEDQLLADYTFPQDTTDLVRQLWLQNDFMGAVYSLNVSTPKLNWLFGGGYNTYFGNHFGKIVRADRGSTIDFDRRFYDSDARKNEINNYVKVTKSLVRGASRIKLFGDLQLRNVAYNAIGIHNDQTNIEFDEFYSFLNPKVGFSTLKRTAQLSKTWEVFMGMSHREPARTDFLESADFPKAERLVNLEVGRSYIHNKWAAQANYYMMYYQNQLVLTGELNNVGAALRTNAGESYRTGIELVGQYKVSKKLELGGNLTLSQNRILDFNEIVLDENYGFDTFISRKNTAIAFSPAIISGINVTYQLRRNLSLLLQNKFVGRQYLDNTQQEDKSLPAYNTTDLIINYRANFSRLTKSPLPINFGLYLYNITNTLYENNGWASSINDNGVYTNFVGVYPQAPFNVMVKASILF